MPTTTAQPQNRTVVQGYTHTFSVAAIGDEPLHYQWRFGSSDLTDQTNSSMALTNIQSIHAGNYQVIVTNLSGAVTSGVAVLTVRGTNDPLFATPVNGWAYIYQGDGIASADSQALDGKWNHYNSSDSWAPGDGRGTGNGMPGGLSSSNGVCTLEDAVTSGSSDVDNRRFYFMHNMAMESSVTNASSLLNSGVTLSFRTRLTPPPPGDPLTELTNAPNGYMNNTSGRGMFGIRQSGGSGMIISFSLNQAVEDLGASTSYNFNQAGLHMNGLNGNARSALVDPNSAGVSLNLLPLNPAVFHEFWVTIQDNGTDPGTHRVTIFIDGNQTPHTFNVTAGTASDIAYADPGCTNYLALGLGHTGQRGALDVDYFAYQAGVILPAAFNDPVGIVAQPTNQFLLLGQVGSFNIGVTGTPPFAFQWFKNGNPVAGATNAVFVTEPVNSADDEAQLFVVVSNSCNIVTSSPPALIKVVSPPVIITQPQDQMASAGTSVQFSVIAESEVGISYQWRYNGGDLPGETASTLVIPSVSFGHTGDYDVLISNYAGTVTSIVARLRLVAYDFGDAPEPFPTAMINNGARHRFVAGVFLGAGIDSEPDCQGDSFASADDMGAVDDEDGLTFITVLQVGQPALLQVVASTNGFFNAWIDFGADGSWSQALDQIFTNHPLVPGTNLVGINIPPVATAGDTYARFRFDTAGGLSFDGPAIDGEVEDYAVKLVAMADLHLSVTASAEPVLVASNLTFNIIVSNKGPSTAHGVVMTNALPANVTFVSATPTQGACVNTELGVQCELGDLASHSAAMVNVLVVPSASGTLSNYVSVTSDEPDPQLANNTTHLSVEVVTWPEVLIEPVNLTVSEGGFAEFTVLADGTPPLTYQWFWGEMPLQGETNSILVISNAVLANVGAYRAQITNAYGSATSSPAILTVLVYPGISQQPRSTTNNAGGTATFFVQATGSEPLFYQWYFNTDALQSQTNPVLSLSAVQKAQAGDYTVSVSNLLGVVTSLPATLVVFEYDFGDAPDPAFPTLLANDGARHIITPGFHLGDGVDFEADGKPSSTGEGDDLDGSDENGITFKTPLLLGQSATLEVVASSNGWLNAWLDYSGNSSWGDAGEQVFTNIFLSPGTNVLSLRVPLDALCSNSFARFRFSTIPDLSFKGEAPDGEVEDYRVSILPAVDLVLGISEQPSLVGTGSNFTTTLNVRNEGSSTATSVSLVSRWPQDTTIVSVETGQGSYTVSDGIVTCNLGSIAPSGSVSVQLTVSSMNDGELTNLTTVTCLESDINPANNTAFSVTRVLESPSIRIQPVALTVTNGGNATFGIVAEGTDLTYQWLFDGGELPFQTKPSLHITNAQPENGGLYSVLVGNDLGTVTSAAVTLTVLVPVRIILQPQNHTAILGDSITFSVQVDGSLPFSCQWIFNGNALSGETAPSLILSNVQAQHAGEYKVLVANAAGEELTEPAILSVLELPVVILQPQSQTNFAGSQVTLSADARGTEPLLFQWYHENYSLPDATNKTLLFTNLQTTHAGNYFVVVTNIAGAATSSVARLVLIEMDFGDSPETYSTTMAFDGARHEIITGIHLGTRVDYEPDGLPDLYASSDDLINVDDEDGIMFGTPIHVGETAHIQVVASTNGFLDGWIDFARDGTWAEASDRIFAGVPLVEGTNTVAVQVPVTAFPTNTFARFRFNTHASVSFDGPAPDGEVEDYALSILPVINLAVTTSVEPVPAVVNSNIVFTVSVTNQGPCAATDVWVTNTLPAGMSCVGAALPVNCTPTATGVVCNLGAIPVGQRTEVLLTLTAPAQPQVVSILVTAGGVEFEPNRIDNTAALNVPIVSGSNLFSNNDMIVIPQVGPAGVYPSSIFVSGLTAEVYKVTVTLKNLNHSYPADLNVLLVGPGGQTVLLMADVGTAFGVNNVTLTFDDDASSNLPDRIFSGVYKPTHRNPAPTSMPIPAPVGPYGEALTALKDTDANGTWTLYISDDSDEDGGYIAGGWNIEISTLNPLAELGVSQISIPNAVFEGETVTYLISITNSGPGVATGVTLVDRLPEATTFLSASIGAGIFINENGVFTCQVADLAPGAETSLSVTVATTSPGAITNHVTVSAREKDLLLENNTNMVVTDVAALTDLHISMTASMQPAHLNQDLTYTFSVTNSASRTANAVVFDDELPVGSTFVSASSSQGLCVNNGTAVQCAIGDMPSGSVVAITLRVRPNVVGIFTNAATVVSSTTDVSPANNTASLVTTVVVPFGPFHSSSDITLPQQGPAAPYPSILYVSGLTAEVFRVSVTLSNLSHPAPEELSFLLVGPDGQNVLLASGAGGGYPVNDLALAFEDGALDPLPDQGPLVAGTYRPANYSPEAPAFVSPAPLPPYGSGLSAFRNSNPNGTWALYIIDNTPGNAGTLGGWSLAVETFNPIVDLALTALNAPEFVAVGSNFVYSIQLTNRGPAPATAVVVTNVLPPSLYLVSVTSSLGDCHPTVNGIECNIGTLAPQTVTVISLTCRSTVTQVVSLLSVLSIAERDVYQADNVWGAVITFESPPSITAHPLNQIRTNNDSVIFSLGASGSEPLSYQWQHNGVDLPFATNSVMLLTNLSVADAGTYQALIRNRVGEALSQPATLTILSRPTISSISAQVVDEDSVIPEIVFDVGDLETPLGSLVIQASSSDSGLIADSDLVIARDGAQRILLVSLPPNRFGTTLISLQVIDVDGIQSTSTFPLTVRPVNDLPEMSPFENQVINEDEPALLYFKVADVETAPDVLQVLVHSSDQILVPDANIFISGVGSNRMMRIVPAGNKTGVAQIAVQLRDLDGAGVNRNFEIQVRGVNDLPALQMPSDVTVDEDSGSHFITLTGISSGAPDELQELRLSAHSSNPELIAAPTLIYTSPGSYGYVIFTQVSNAVGTAWITVTVDDGQSTNSSVTRTCQIVVVPFNDPPSISPIQDIFLVEDTSSSWIPFSIDDVDSGLDSVTLSAGASLPELFQTSGVEFSGTGKDRSLRLSPAPNSSGQAIITIEVRDQDGAMTATSFQTTVAPVNDAPTIAPIADVTLRLNSSPQSILLSGITSGAVEEEEHLTVTAHDSPQGILSDLQVAYTSPATNALLTFGVVSNMVGTATVTVSVMDDGASNNLVTRSFNVVVQPNIAPAISLPNQEIVVFEDSGTNWIGYLVSDADSDPGTLRVTAHSSNQALLPDENISVVRAGHSGLLGMLPLPNQFGTSVLTLTVSDLDGGTSSTSAILSVQPVNDAPTVNAIADLAIEEDSGMHTIQVTGITSGASNEPQNLSVTVSANPSGILSNLDLNYTTPESTAILTFTTRSNVVGEATVTVFVEDDGGTFSMTSRSLQVRVTPVNDPPSMSLIDDQVINEDTLLGPVPLLIQDIETAARNILLTGSSDNQALIPDSNINFGGSLSNRTVSLAPRKDQFGSAIITIRAEDDTDGIAQTTFKITVQPVNDPPSMDQVPDQSITENSTLSISLHVDDPETPAQGLGIVISSSDEGLLPNSGLLLEGTGTNRVLTITPSANVAGEVTVSIEASDPGQAICRQTFVLRVLPVNHPPTLDPIPDLTLQEDAGMQTIILSGISNGDINGTQTLTIRVWSSNTHIVPDPVVNYLPPATTATLTFTPVTNVNGSATVFVSLTDGQSVNNLSIAEFQVVIDPVNDVPSISSIANQDTSLSTPTLPAMFSIADAETPSGNLQLTAQSSNPSLIPAENITFGGIGALRTVMLSPVPGQSGESSITVTVTDADGAYASTAFQLRVAALNIFPSVSTIPEQVIPEDGIAGPLSFIISDPDTSISNLLVSVLSSNIVLAPLSGITVSGSGPARTITLVPAPSQAGTSLISILVADGTGATKSSFLLTVTPVNDSPSISVVDDQVMNEDSTLVVPIVIGDAESLIQSLSITAHSTNAILVPDSNLIIDGLDENRNLTIIPAPDQFGTTLITLWVSDGQSSNSTTFRVTVQPVNDPPTLNPLPPIFFGYDPGVVTVNLSGISSGANNEAQTLIVSVSNDRPGFYAQEPTANYTSPDTTGTITLRPTGTGTKGVGSNTVTVTVRDGASTNNQFVATFGVFCQPRNSPLPPAATGIANQNTPEGTATPPLPFRIWSTTFDPGTLGLTGHSSNPSLLPNGNIIFGGSGSNRTVSLVPVAGRSGAVQVTLSVTDNNYGGTNISFTLTVNPVNAAPIIFGLTDISIPENTSVGPLPFVVSDRETPTPVLNLTAYSDNPVLVPNGNIKVFGTGTNRALFITPASNQVGTASIAITAHDGVNSATNGFILTITPANHLPVISSVPDQETLEDTPVNIEIAISDLESPVGNLVLSGVSFDPTLVPPENIVLSGTGASRTVVITPAAHQSGMTTITLTIHDGNGGNTSASFTLLVAPVNDAPAIGGLTGLIIPENTTSSPQVFRIADPETCASNLLVSARSSNPTLLSDVNIFVSGSGSNRFVSVTPNANQNGMADITLMATDEAGATATASFALTVSPVNSLPEVSNFSDIVIDEDNSSGSIPFAIRDLETPSDALLVSAHSGSLAILPDNAFKIIGNGINRILEFTPASNQFGTVLVTISVTDQAETSATSSFSVTVNPVNDPPVIGPIPDQQAIEATPTGAIPFFVSDQETLAGNLVLSAQSLNQQLLPDSGITLGGGSGSDRMLIVTPAPGEYGMALITVTVTDSFGAQASTSFSVSVEQGTFAPTIVTEPEEKTVQQNGPVSFAITATGTAPLTYEWFRNGVSLPEQTNSAFHIAHAQLSDAGDYTVTISNARGSVTSSPATLRVLVQTTIVRLVKTTNQAEISFPTLACLRYTVEYSDFVGGTWRTLEVYEGDGQAIVVQDSAARASSRFYRVRVE